MAFVGRHDGEDGTSTVLMADHPDNPGHPSGPTRWFARSAAFAVLCPAPFHDAPLPVPPGAMLRLRYAFVVVDGEPDDDTCTTLAGF
jgi:hypothetical protein